MRFSDTLEWMVPSDVFCEVVFIEFVVEQWSRVSSVLETPGMLGSSSQWDACHSDRTLLSQEIEDDGWNSRRPRGHQSRPGGSVYYNIGGTSMQYPMPKARAIESPTVGRRGQEVPHSLLTSLMKRIETLKSSSAPPPGLEPPALGTSTAPNLLVVPPNLTARLDRIAAALRKGRGKASFEAGYMTDLCAAQSEEEYDGIILRHLRSGTKLGNQELLEKVKKIREEYPASVLAPTRLL